MIKSPVWKCALALAALIATVGGAHGQPLSLEQTLTSTTAPGQFGKAVAVDGDTLVIGAPTSSVNGNGRQGTAHIYRRVGGSWSLQQQISGSGGVVDDGFGSSVDVSGNTLVAGAPHSLTIANPKPGAAYVFVWNGTAWVEQAKLLPPGAAPTAEMWFGKAVRVVGETIFVGAPSGRAAYVFRRSGTTWTGERLVPAGATTVSGFGSAIDVAGDVLCIGANTDPAGAIVRGSAFIFGRTGNTWTVQQKLEPTDGAHYARYGEGCAVDGETVAVAAYQAPGSGATDAGAVYVYRRSGGTWTLEQKIVPPVLTVRYFGYDLALRGNVLLVGAPVVTNGATMRNGSAFVFERSGATWSLSQRVVPTDVTSSQFGEGVALDDALAFVGRTYPTESVAIYSRGGATSQPGAPTNLQASANGNVLSMSWGPPTSGAAPTSYTLIARATPGGAVLGTLPLGNVTSFAAAAPNGVFALSLTATNASGTGPESAAVTVTLPSLSPPPGAPTNLTATVLGSTATLTWTAPASGGPVGNYALVAGLTPGFAVPLGTLPLPAGSTSTVIPGIPPGTYYVRVLAQNASGTSAASNEVAITVAAPAAPGAPTLNPPTVTGNTVGLSWLPGGGGAPTSYVLTALTSGGVVLGSAPLSGSAASFPGVPGGSYLLRLVAVNSVGPSPASNTVTLVVP